MQQSYYSKRRRKDKGDSWTDREAADELSILTTEPVKGGFLKRFIEGRVFEWVMTLSMIMMAVEIFIWPESIEKSAFRYVLDVGSSKEVGIACLFIGWTRFSALMLNGQKIWNVKAGPYIRSVCSVVSSLVWFQFVFALIQLSVVQDFPSLGIPVWATATIAELYIAYQTVKNAR